MPTISKSATNGSSAGAWFMECHLPNFAAELLRALLAVTGNCDWLECSRCSLSEARGGRLDTASADLVFAFLWRRQQRREYAATGGEATGHVSDHCNGYLFGNGC